MADLSKWDHKINPFQDLLDTREIMDRIEEIESEYLDTETGEPITAPGAWEDGDRAEWEGLQEIISAVGEVASRRGVTLIRESYFAEHIKDEYLEIGPELHEFDPNAYRYRRVPLDELFSRMPFDRIDWKAVAEDCRSDYSIYEFDGVTYYYLEP